MSHFTVAVITRTGCETEINEALDPFYQEATSGPYVEAQSSFDDVEDSYNLYEENYKFHAASGEYKLKNDPFFMRDATPEETEKVNATRSTFSENGEIYVKTYNCVKKLYDVKVLDYPAFPEWTSVLKKCNEVETLLEYAKREYGDLDCIIEGQSEADLSWNQWFVLNDKNELIDFMEVHNTQAKFDWAVIGGRWDGMLKTKDGESVNTCQLNELDFDGEKERLIENANKQYDYFEKLAGEYPKEWQTWKEIVDDPVYTSIEQRRDAYNSQPFVKHINQADTEKLFSPIIGLELDSFKLSRESHCNAIEQTAFLSYNLLNSFNGEWFGSDIGFWGITIREEENWETKYKNMLDTFNQNHYITIVDCHS